MRFFTGTILFISCLFSISQTRVQKKIDLAEILYNKGSYHEAAEVLEKALDIKQSQEALLLMSSTQFKLRHFDQAEYYSKEYLLETSEDSTALIIYFKSLRNQGKYQLIGEDPLLDTTIAELKGIKQDCDSSLVWLTKPKYTAINLKKINSPQNDVAPVLYKNDLVFSSSRLGTIIEREDEKTGAAYYDLFKSGHGKNGWERPLPFSIDLNTPNNEGAVCFDKNFDEIYITQSEYTKRENRNHSEKNQLKLYKSTKTKTGWSVPEWFVLNDSSSSFAHPFITPDGKAFLFSSDLPGGYGNSDIYISLKINDSLWTKPKNLGPEVNTPDHEMYPNFINGILYFSSNGHVGMGGFDLYSAELYKGKWVNIKHLPYGINTSYDEVSPFYISDKKKLLFSSNRPEGKGELDIYISKLD